MRAPGSPVLSSRATPRMPRRRSRPIWMSLNTQQSGRRSLSLRLARAGGVPSALIPIGFTSSGVMSITDVALESFDATKIFATLVGSDFAHDADRSVNELLWDKKK